MKKILAFIVSAAAISTIAFATEPAKPAKPQMSFADGKWSLRAFYGFATGDIKSDTEVDSIFGGGLEYTLPNVGQSTAGAFSIGAEYSGSSKGVAGFTVQNYGLYAGFAFPLGQNPGMAGLEAIVRAGYFNTQFKNDSDKDDRWGFGFDFGLRYKVQKFWVEAYYRQRPSLDGIDNNAFTIGINFPLGN